MITRFVKDERGATAIEYGLLASFIALALILAATTLGQKTAGSFDSAAAGFK
ncbi:MAG: Flp family type IVb pilin [Hyphomicrobiaceae bacterium]|nr:Flp family type IVb pilin [Hyphomicrobiaceae bacterium]